jgi:peptide/nickel transport system substrate-binding protein
MSFPEQPQWHSTAGAELYNQKNPAKARKLLQEAGYTGTPVRWITTKEYQWMFKNALGAKQQLESAGFKIDLQVWTGHAGAAAQQARGVGRVLDRHHVQSRARVLHRCRLRLAGWWCHEDKEQWMAAMARETDVRKRKAMWDKVQQIFYEDVGRVKLGDFFGLDAVRKEVHGYRVLQRDEPLERLAEVSAE